jgi:hypothetical protein
VTALPLRFLRRHHIDDAAWNTCVTGAHNALLYGHSWYLDAVTNVPTPGGPRWRWEGLVQTDGSGRYVAVLPVPLRRRWGRWVVYQPLFCQFLAVFSEKPIDLTPFLEALVQQYRYASRLCLLANAPFGNVPAFIQQQVAHTHILGSGNAHYSTDRHMNLRRAHRRVAETPGWQVRSSGDIGPLLTLFKENHAQEIGVGTWAYPLCEQLFRALQAHGIGTLRYAYVDDVPIGGALFVVYHRRTIYLFNAANAEGRRLNARTLLLDEAIRQREGLFDFESPDKHSVVQFYESFGATPSPYLVLSWSRLTWSERWVAKTVQTLRCFLRKGVGRFR